MMRTLSWALLAALASLGAGWGIASAQPGTATVDAPTPPDKAPANLTPKQQLARVNQMLNAMRAGRQTVRKMLSEARAAKDVVKALCLKDKLNQIDVTIRSARDRRDKLKGAVEKNDAAQASTDFAICESLNGTARDLVTQANQCIGEETGIPGDSELTVDIDPDIPDEDLTGFPPGDVSSEPPVTTSPFQ